MPEPLPQVPMPTAAPPGSSTLLGGTNLSATPPQPSLDNGRFGNDPSLPEWARGKTKEEVLGITKSLVESFPRAGQQAPSGAPPAHSPPPASPMLDPESYVTNRDMQAMRDAAGQQFSGSVSRAVDLAADANYNQIKREYQKEFNRYLPEIHALLGTVAKDLWTIDNLKRVVKMVQVDHFDDYRSEMEAEVASKQEVTMRSMGSAGSLPVSQADKALSLESEKIPAEWKVRAQQKGISESTVQEFCRANEMSEIEFYKQFETPMNAIVGDRSGR